MSNIYRIMECVSEEIPQPLAGDRKCQLGVRVGPGIGKFDVEKTATNTILPRSGGLSVNQDWKQLPHFLIPPRLAHLLPPSTKTEARGGNNKWKVFRLAEFEFVEGELLEYLWLRIDQPNHGLIEPLKEVDVMEFQEQLAATANHWVIDES